MNLERRQSSLHQLHLLLLKLRYSVEVLHAVFTRQGRPTVLVELTLPASGAIVDLWTVALDTVLLFLTQSR